MDEKAAWMERRDLDALLRELSSRGFEVVGPTVRDGAIAYAPVTTSAELPEGWTDRQDAGAYRIERRGDAALFGYNVGPHSWKQFLFPSEMRLWRAERTPNGFTFEADERPAPSYAALGVRACELAAIRIQDRVFMGGEHRDVSYTERRERMFIVAVNCGQAGATCFCASMNTGPKVSDGFDLALTEVIEGETHGFLAMAGSDRGREVLNAIPHREAGGREHQLAEAAVAQAEAQMGRALDTRGLAEALRKQPEHPRWDEVARRCLTCANCTMVCPTCFCHTVEDHTDLTGDHAERWRKWDSCFSQEFSYLHGGSVRTSSRSRYRQWLTHKLSTWVDQFGEMGCVGCGRCIAWCPVGIDITVEAHEISQEPS